MSLAQSNATKLTRQLLIKHGFDGAKFTEKSLKVQGVTELLDASFSGKCHGARVLEEDDDTAAL